MGRLNGWAIANLKLLSEQAAAWAATNLARLMEAETEMPGLLGNRSADDWRPLLAIAGLAGGR